MTGQVLLTAASAAVAAAALPAPGPRRVPLRGGPAPASGRSIPCRAVLLFAVLAAAVVGLLVSVPAVLVSGAVLGVAAVLRAELRAGGAARVAAVERVRVGEFTAALAAELRAGREPRAALLAATASVPVGRFSAQLAAAASAGSDLGAALRGAGTVPGAEQLREVAACWQVAEGTGAGLAAGVQAASAAALDREAHRRRVAAELAGVRATGWLLAALPLLGMVLGAAMGAQPWRVLLGTPAGAALLAVGLALDVLGVVWVRRLARAAEGA